MVKTVSGQPGGSPAGLQPRQAGSRNPAGRVFGSGPAGQYTARERTAALIRRRHLAPYILLLPSMLAIAALVLWPAVQIGLFSFQNYGLPQVTGAAATDWIGAGNYTAILSDPEFWLSLRISLIFAAVVVPLTLLTGTLVGLLLNRLGRRMATFVSGAALLAWATPAVSASVIFVWLADPDGGVGADGGTWTRLLSTTLPMALRSAMARRAPRASAKPTQRSRSPRFRTSVAG